MEFDEMKKIWDIQSNQAMYAIDETALRKRVSKRRNKAARIADYTEKILSGALLLSSSLIVGVNLYTGEYKWLTLVLSALMYGMAAFVLVKRSKRLKWQNTFSNSILGDLDEALANARYQVTLSQSSRWFFYLVAVFSVVSITDSVQDWWKGVVLTLIYVVVYFMAKWEHNAFYVSQKRSLESMRQKLVQLQDDPASASDLNDQL